MKTSKSCNKIKSEACAYRNSEVIKKVCKGLKEAAEGKIKRTDNLETFLKNL